MTAANTLPGVLPLVTIRVGTTIGTFTSIRESILYLPLYVPGKGFHFENYCYIASYYVDV